MRNLNENFYFWNVLKETPANMAKFATFESYDELSNLYNGII